MFFHENVRLMSQIFLKFFSNFVKALIYWQHFLALMIGKVMLVSENLVES